MLKLFPHSKHSCKTAPTHLSDQEHPFSLSKPPNFSLQQGRQHTLDAFPDVGGEEAPIFKWAVMGIEKQSSKGGNYVGGFLNMFDWNAKSRKKLFSSKPEVAEQCIQKKRCDGNSQTNRLHMMDVDEHTNGSSVKGSNDHSCASSVVDEDFYSTKAPGVVARLMGLDFLPKSNTTEPYSTPLFNLYNRRDQTMHHSGSLHDVNEAEQNYPRVMQKLEKFQTEILPPKSAKSIPITHHKLLSPIKSANFIPHKDAAHIMEAAAKILEPGPKNCTKTKLPPVGSSSAPLRVRDLKEKAQKPSKPFEHSQRKGDSSGVKSLKRSSTSKSSNGSIDSTPIRVMPDSDESSIAMKSKGKSISLALQAKANVQKRGGLNANSNSSLVVDGESSELSMVKKPNCSGVLRQNNQKQNCIVDRGKSSSKCSSKGVKTRSESSTIRQHNSSKASNTTSRVNSRKISQKAKDEKQEVSSSSRERVTSKKRSADGSGKLQMDGSGRDIQSREIECRQSSWDQKSGDVISFTFTSPMQRSSPDSGRAHEARESSRRSSLTFDGSRSSFHKNKIKGGDALSTLLEQKLKELAEKVEFSQQNSETDLHDIVPRIEATTSSSMAVNEAGLEETSTSNSNISRESKLVDCRLPSPVSVLEHSSSAESFTSSDIADSKTTEGSKFSNTYTNLAADIDLSDSASSTAMKTQDPKRWECEFVKEMLSNIEVSFNDYAVGRAQHIVKPNLFNQLGGIPIKDQRLMFDCVGECLDLRFRQYVGGGYKSLAKGIQLVKKKDILAEEVYKEVSGWSLSIGESMIDELVDRDMSNQYGRWLDFEVEAFEIGSRIQTRILNSLIDEVVADILML